MIGVAFGCAPIIAGHGIAGVGEELLGRDEIVAGEKMGQGIGSGCRVIAALVTDQV